MARRILREAIGGSPSEARPPNTCAYSENPTGQAEANTVSDNVQTGVGVELIKNAESVAELERKTDPRGVRFERVAGLGDGAFCSEGEPKGETVQTAVGFVRGAGSVELFTQVKGTPVSCATLVALAHEANANLQ
jgi:hypothetical protein